MFYRATAARRQGSMAMGYATSDDGVRWTRFSGNPVLTAQEIKRTNFYFTNLLYHDGTYFLFWEVDKSGHTHIHLATHTGPLE